MENWVIYGLIAAVCFGVNTVIYKVAATKGNGVNPYLGVLSFGVGLLLFFVIIYLVKMPEFSFNWSGISLAAAAGVIWAVGMLMVALAIANKGSISKLAPIYNINTLVAVFLGIVFLKEIPQAAQILKIIVGSILVVAGAVLVSSS